MHLPLEKVIDGTVCRAWPTEDIWRELKMRVRIFGDIEVRLFQPPALNFGFVGDPVKPKVQQAPAGLRCNDAINVLVSVQWPTMVSHVGLKVDADTSLVRVFPGTIMSDRFIEFARPTLAPEIEWQSRLHFHQEIFDPSALQNTGFALHRDSK